MNMLEPAKDSGSHSAPRPLPLYVPNGGSYPLKVSSSRSHTSLMVG